MVSLFQMEGGRINVVVGVKRKGAPCVIVDIQQEKCITALQQYSYLQLHLVIREGVRSSMGRNVGILITSNCY